MFFLLKDSQYNTLDSFLIADVSQNFTKALQGHGLSNPLFTDLLLPKI